MLSVNYLDYWVNVEYIYSIITCNNAFGVYDSHGNISLYLIKSVVNMVYFSRIDKIKPYTITA